PELEGLELQAISLPSTVLDEEQTINDANLYPRSAVIIKILEDEDSDQDENE
ncbi:MAG: hypothetical protein EZS28_043997, partial [Streblomastix strix]